MWQWFREDLGGRWGQWVRLVRRDQLVRQGLQVLLVRLEQLVLQGQPGRRALKEQLG